MSGIKRVAEFCFRQGGLLCHQFLIFSILYDRYAARDAGFAVDKTPWEHANCYPAVEQQVNFTAQAFGMDDAIWEHLQVHKLVLAVIEEIRQRHAIFLLEYFISLARLARHPITDDGIHGMVSAAAIHTDPA